VPRAPRTVRRHAALVLGCALAALAALAGEAAALEVAVDRPIERDGYVWVHLALDELFEKRTEESLSRGMPATLQLTVELWKRRTGWFDRHVAQFDASIKIRYDVWDRTYRVERRGAPAMLASTIDSLRTLLSRPIELPAARLVQLEPSGRYYVAAAVVLKPLTVEDIAEGEGWLSGEVETRRGSGLGVLTAIPRSVFDVVRNFTGFGDERARGTSEDFDLTSLLFAPLGRQR